MNDDISRRLLRSCFPRNDGKSVIWRVFVQTLSINRQPCVELTTLSADVASMPFSSVECETTHVVRLKLFGLKAEGFRRARLPYFGGNI